jgi:hypothetical protein
MTETQLKQHPVILTRTGAVNQRLALRFSKLGFRTLACLHDQAAGGRDARCEAFFRPFGY